MARGVGAFIFVASLVFAMTILSGLGFYATMNVDVDNSGANQDVQNAANQLNGTSFGENRSPSILEGPLAVVVPFINFVQTLWTVITNTSGILQLLFGLPKIAGDTIETVFRIALTVTGLFAVRGILQ
jgi:hypothetical protein